MKTMKELELESLINRAKITSGSQRVNDLAQALALARKMSGETPRKRGLSASCDLSRVARSSPGTVVPGSNNNAPDLQTSLRDMLTWPELRGCGATLTRIARQLRQLRETE
jgi:hypothetical protein